MISVHVCVFDGHHIGAFQLLAYIFCGVDHLTKKIGKEVAQEGPHRPIQLRDIMYVAAVCPSSIVLEKAARFVPFHSTL
jgi:hypothetical protein